MFSTKRLFFLALALLIFAGCVQNHEPEGSENQLILEQEDQLLKYFFEVETAILNYQQTRLILDSLQYYKKTDNPINLYKTKIDLAENLRKGGNFEAGVSYLENVIQNPSLRDDLYGRAYNRLAAIYLEQGYHRQIPASLDSAIVNAINAFEIARALSDVDLIVSSLIIWASALNYQGNYAEAEDLLLEAKHLNKSHGIASDLPLLYNLAKNYLSMSKHDQALATISRYLDEAEIIGTPRSIDIGLRVLAEIYEATGEHDLKANVVNQIESTAADKAWMIENLLLNQLLSSLEITQSQEMIDDLRQERFFLISYNRVLILFALLAASLIIGVLFLLHQRTKKILLLKEVFSLEQQSNKLEAENTRLQMQLKEEENNRLAADIAAKESNLVSKVLLIGKIQKFLDKLLNELKDFNYELKLARNRKKLDKIIQIVKTQVNEGPWIEFENLYASGNSAFVVNLLAKHPGLTPFEKRLCMLLQMNLTTKEISDITTQSTRAIEMARYRLRKKFDLGRDEKLSDYLTSFALKGQSGHIELQD